MNDERLFFKSKTINGNDLEITFHKDFVWIFNEKPLPVVSYKLANCQDLTSVKFDVMDEFIDGVVVDIIEENNRSIFETYDMSDFKTKIVCDKVVKEEREYNRQDFIDLLNEIFKQRDYEYEVTKEFKQREEDLKIFLKHELDVTERKITQADWLAEDKKHFLDGQQNILKKIIEAIERREREDFDKRIREQNMKQAAEKT